MQPTNHIVSKLTFCLLSCLYFAEADIYMHNPRGSNNRLDEEGRARNNANRLFDSQNNNRGGYNVGSLYYYHGSKLPIEWTNQHSCNSPNNHCELIIQYMCGDNVRDGATTTTIPDNLMQCENQDCSTDTEYGMHEDFDYYLNCKLRKRNQGLFVADQNLKNKNRAKNTRQNPNGNRRGYECPEERDYYPYWHPTPWKDIAIMTNNATRCPYYKAESENVKGRWACFLPSKLLKYNEQNGIYLPNTKEECEAYTWPENAPEGTQAEWKYYPSHSIATPDCRENEFSRDNHLGNGIGGYPNLYNWTIPDSIEHERCVMRIRYNVSTADYDGWNTNASHNPASNNEYPQILFSQKYGLESEEEATNRGYNFKNNPKVQIFKDVPGLTFQLAINTAQFGRTFQDRSHTFAVRPRPTELEGVTIHNVNVRGKRGNIVQVYPGVEYDFVPNTLTVSKGDYVHYQWTGSNSNPQNNDGQGRKGTDRSNVVLQRLEVYNEGSGLAYSDGSKHGHWGRSYPELVSKATLLGLSQEDLMSLALLTPNQFRGEMSELDDAGTYFDIGPRKVTRTGVFHYLCTRNNNFSNRSQKGRIICKDIVQESEAIGWNGGQIALSNGKARMTVEQGDFEQLWKIQMEEWQAEQAEAAALSKNKNINIGDAYASNFYRITPEEKMAVPGKEFTVAMNIESSGLEEVAVYRTGSDSFATWTKVDALIDSNLATFSAQEGGLYVAVRHKKTGTIVGTTLGVIALIAVIVVATVIYKKRNPEAFSGITRSFQAKV